MKKLMSLILAACCVVMLLTACQNNPSSAPESSSQSAVVDYTYSLDAENVQVYDVGIPSRGIEIPGTLTLPAGKESDRVPLVIFEHDLFGDRSTHGVFEEIALGQNRVSPVFRSIFPAAATAPKIFRITALSSSTGM